MNDVTGILMAIADGRPQAAEDLLPLVYEELRRLAAQRLAHERPGQTLQPTALVHEAYLRLVRAENEQSWDTCGHFFVAATEAMRRILVESARRKHRLKRGGDRQRIDLELAEAASTGPSDDLLAIDEALDRLTEEDPLKAELVKLRFFAGLSIEESAQCLRISRSTADRYWVYARAWLYDRLATTDDGVSP
jgi:RNA polymerase sigma factor (TIGR02999 family)